MTAKTIPLPRNLSTGEVCEPWLWEDARGTKEIIWIDICRAYADLPPTPWLERIQAGLASIGANLLRLARS